jgi:hypothetical protein
MQHYSRECERGQTRIAELERLQRNCESGIAALEACWTQVLIARNPPSLLAPLTMLPAPGHDQVPDAP